MILPRFCPSVCVKRFWRRVFVSVVVTDCVFWMSTLITRPSQFHTKARMRAKFVGFRAEGLLHGFQKNSVSAVFKRFLNCKSVHVKDMNRQDVISQCIYLPERECHHPVPIESSRSLCQRAKISELQADGARPQRKSRSLRGSRQRLGARIDSPSSTRMSLWLEG